MLLGRLLVADNGCARQLEYMKERRLGRYRIPTKAVLVASVLLLFASCGTTGMPAALAKLSGTPVIVSNVLPLARSQQAYRAVLAADGGIAPYTWTLSDGILPDGVILGRDGILAGTPQLPGEFYFTVQAVDSATTARSISKRLVLQVQPQGLSIITTSSVLPWGNAGSVYEVHFAAWGGVKPYTWRVEGGVPPGLKLYPDGTLGGVLSLPGDFSFKVTLRDAAQSVTREFHVHVSPARVDKFGGLLAVRSASKSTGFWRTEKIGGHWFLVTPEGHGFWMVGLWGASGDSHRDERGGTYDDRVLRKYGNLPTVWLQANRRLRSWGFNTLGPWTYRMALPTDEEREWGGTQPVKFPFVIRGRDPSIVGRDDGIFKNIMGGLDPNVTVLKGIGGNFPDVFDSAWVVNTQKLYAEDKLFHAAAKSEYCIGAFSDDTDYLSGFGSGPEFATDPPGKIHNHLGYLALVMSPAQAINKHSKPAGRPYADPKVYTKYALRDFLRVKYGTIQALNASWGSTYTTFDSDGSWPNGNGLLDENGRSSHGWLGDGSPVVRPTSGMSRAMVADLDEFLYRIARQFFQVQRDAMRRYSPHTLFFGPTNIGGWAAPARAPIYKAASEILDVISVTNDGSQQQLDFITANTGDIPLTVWSGFVANPDSSRWRHTDADVASASWWLKSQAARGQRYRRYMEHLVSGRSSVTATQPYVGMMWWWWMDMINEQKNWGLVSLMDNAYDGVEAGMSPGIDAWGFPTGGEEKNYGDFIGPARAMNYSIMERLSTEFGQSTPPASPGVKKR